MTVFICGDSTAQTYTEKAAPQGGWGQCIGEFLPGAEVVNAAMGGRSTKSFISEGRLQRVEAQLKQGDLMLIQFTHNDASDLVWRHTDPWTSFRSNLEIFVDTARIHGAVPVLLTPIPLRTFTNGELQPGLGEYPDAVRVTARECGCALIEVYEAAVEEYRRLGEEGSRKYHIHVKPGEYESCPAGRDDDVHTCMTGARFYAEMIADGLKKLGIIS